MGPWGGGKGAAEEAKVPDLANQWPHYKVAVTPVVLGDLGIIAGLSHHLRESGVLNERAIRDFVGHAQREVLCAAVQIIKRHMTQ